MLAPKDIKEFKAKLFVFYMMLPNSKEKEVLGKIIKETNRDRAVDLKNFLIMVHNKVDAEKNKQTSNRNPSLKIWANIINILVEYLKGVNVEGTKPKK